MKDSIKRKPFYGLIREDLLKKLKARASKERRSMVSIIEILIDEMPK